jgi:hypothetical protein
MMAVPAIAIVTAACVSRPCSMYALSVDITLFPFAQGDFYFIFYLDAAGGKHN